MCISLSTLLSGLYSNKPNYLYYLHIHPIGIILLYTLSVLAYPPSCIILLSTLSALSYPSRNPHYPPTHTVRIIILPVLASYKSFGSSHTLHVLQPNCCINLIFSHSCYTPNLPEFKNDTIRCHDRTAARSNKSCIGRIKQELCNHVAK
jgi:hypothetical protein